MTCHVHWIFGKMKKIKRNKRLFNGAIVISPLYPATRPNVSAICKREFLESSAK
jgi:hypothetical protein